MLGVSHALASPAPLTSRLSSRALPDGVINRFCAGPGTTFDPFDLLPQEDVADCKALLDDLLATRDSDVDTGGGGESLTETESDTGPGTKMVNNDATFAFGTQMSGSADGASSTSVLEIIARNDTNADNGAEQITV